MVSIVVLFGDPGRPGRRCRSAAACPGWAGRWRSTPPISFVTNTNWQSYAGESTLGYTAQMAGLAVQNFVSAAVGIAVAAALIRGFLARGTGNLGNFWVDLVRIVLRVLLPISVVGCGGPDGRRA